MIRAVLDTNVLASGFVGFEDAKRAPSGLLHLWRSGHFELVVSAEILRELINTFNIAYFRRKLSPEQMERARRLLEDYAESTVIATPVSGVASHREDDGILATALSARADYLVTGDSQLQRLGAYMGVVILSPRAFLDLLEMNPGDEP